MAQVTIGSIAHTVKHEPDDNGRCKDITVLSATFAFAV